MRITFPLKVEFEITSRCNQRCRHCMVETNRGQARELSTAEIRALIDDWVEAGLLELQFTGGEPMLRPDLAELVEYAGSRGLKVLLSTNGTCVTPEAARRLGESGAYVEVSLDGATPEVHDSIRGPGTFQLTVAGIQLLRQHNKRVLVETVVQPRNLGDLENIFLLAESLGAYRHLFHNVRFAGRAFVNRQSLALDRQMLLQAQERVVALRNLHRLQVQPPYLPVDNYARRLRGEYQGKVFGCGGLSFKCGVKSDGTVVPCLLFTAAFSLGRVSPARRLADIWNQDQAVRLHQTLHGEPHPGCQHCDHLTWCGGGCRYAAWTQGGDLSGQDQSCPDVR